ncbi:hypothetical protein, partial [Klebsiella pneumoniae]|uniref:hypothetical protein n=1 Tax=Klebsiella pneumoniae TaxID=573 RepID=UPI001C0CE09E
VAIELQIGHDFFVNFGAHFVKYPLTKLYQYYHEEISWWNMCREGVEGLINGVCKQKTRRLAGYIL